MMVMQTKNSRFHHNKLYQNRHNLSITTSLIYNWSVEKGKIGFGFFARKLDVDELGMDDVPILGFALPKLGRPPGVRVGVGNIAETFSSSRSEFANSIKLKRTSCV